MHPRRAVVCASRLKRGGTAAIRLSGARCLDNRESATKARLGHKRERALAELPRKIENLQAEMATLNAELADLGLYARDAGAFAARTTRLGQAPVELDAAETEWLELELVQGGPPAKALTNDR